MATPQEIERARISTATRMAKRKRGSVGYDAAMAAIENNQARRTGGPIVTNPRRATPTTPARGINVSEDAPGRGGIPGDRFAFDESMPGEYAGPNQMLGQLGPEGGYAGPRRGAPTAPLVDRFGDPTIPQGAPRTSGPTRGNYEDFVGKNQGVNVDRKMATEGPRILGTGTVGPGREGAMTKFGRGRTERYGADPTLTNLTGDKLTAGMEGELPDTQYDFTAQGGKRRPADRLDIGNMSAVYTDEQGNSRNSTDAYYENQLAESEHRNAMTREAGRASERAGDGQVRTLGRGPAQGRFAAMARMAGQRRGRADQMKRRSLSQKDRQLDIQEQQNQLGPSAHPAQAALWEAEAQYKQKMTEGALTKEDQKNMDLQKTMFSKGAEMEKAALDMPADSERRTLAMKQASAMKRGMELFLKTGKIEAIDYGLWDEKWGKVDVEEQEATYGERPIFPRNQKK